MKTKILLILLLSFNLYAQKDYVISLGEIPKYKQDFKHFKYVNKDAKKGGIFKLSARGTYDSLNPFILKGISADGIGLIYDSLMQGSLDESSVYYPLLAQNIEVAPNNFWVKFYLNPNAKFSDGVQVKASDVKFTFDTLVSKASPVYKQYYSDVKDVEVINDLTVKFNFKTNKNKELALILASLSILPEHFYKNIDFKKSSNLKAIGSGPYIIDKYEFGKYIQFKRNKNYWAKDLNVNVGSYNFNKIKYDYYKDQTVTLEAFKSGEFDFRQEYTSKTWATMYKGKNFKNGNIIKENRVHKNAQGMQAFVFNLRNPLFSSLETRKAINLAFDFEWTNKKLFYSQYKRSNSYFENSELKSTGLPSKDELKLLNPLKDLIPTSVFEKKFKNNVTNGKGNIRLQLRYALKMLKEDCWKFENKVLVKNGKKFEFEIILYQPAFERVVQPFIKNLKKIGIIVKLKVLDAVSYTNRVKNFNYDMIVSSFGVSLYPGNELYSFWGEKSADIIGSRNHIGIKNKAVDNLINEIVISHNREDLITAVKALDRVMLHNYYLIPQWYNSSYRIAYWNKFIQPKVQAKYDIGMFTWFFKDEYLRNDMN